MASLKRKRLSLSEKYKVISKLEWGTKPSKVPKKYDVPRNYNMNVAGTWK